MKQEDILRMACEAGIRSAVMLAHFKSWDALCDYEHEELDRFMSFAALVAAAEREACAKVCDEKSDPLGYANLTAEACAVAIRARGQA